MKKYFTGFFVFLILNITSIKSYAIVFNVLEDFNWSESNGLSFTIFGLKETYSKVICSYYAQNLAKFSENNNVTEIFETLYTESPYFKITVTNSTNCDAKNDVFTLLIQCSSKQEPPETSAYTLTLRDRCKS